jgi:TonB family protein
MKTRNVALVCVWLMASALSAQSTHDDHAVIAAAVDARHRDHVVLSTPEFSADGNSAIVRYRCSIAGIDGVAEIQLARSDGRWRVTSNSFRRSDARVENPMRVGDEKPPVLVRRVDPVKTDEAAAANVRGIVIIEAIIDDQGRVDQARVLKPLPFGLDQAALDAVMQWKFRPATFRDQPVAVVFNLTVNFR